MAVSKLHRTLRGRASLLSLDKCNKYLLHLQTVSIQRDRESVGNIYEGRGRGHVIPSYTMIMLYSVLSQSTVEQRLY